MKITSLRGFRSLASKTTVWLTLASVWAFAFALALFATPAAHAQTYSVIHTFSGDPGTGSNPSAGVTIRNGILYGTTNFSMFQSGPGAVYQIQHLGENWITTTISQLSAGGYTTGSRVLFGPDGHPYGTTVQGGSNNFGMVFDLVVRATICKTANCFWTENVLYQFQGIPDGYWPGYGDLVWDKDGNIYGTTIDGGQHGYGSVYELTRSGNSYTESVVYSFTGSDGAYPYNGVIFNSTGHLFGTTVAGGSSNLGAVYELTYSPGVGWVNTVLYSFQNGSDGSDPFGGLLVDASGNLYGTTDEGGSGGGGIVYELSPSGNGWTFTVLSSFAGNSACGPQAPLTMDAAGNLYGTTMCDGTQHLGTVFKLTNTGNSWTYTSLHDFAGGTDGKYPRSNVTFDANGNLYGTTEEGGFKDNGVVWMIEP